jgi:molybdate transport system permease protein
MFFTEADLAAISLTLRLALTTTLLLLVFSTPLAWWLATTRSRWKVAVSAVVALPLVLPPTVIGFYLLLAMGPQGPLGQLSSSLGLGPLAFSFSGLVIASACYSLPFVVQPIQNAMEAMGRRPVEVAQSLGAGPVDCFFSVVLPLSKAGFLSAAVLGFAHTVGEFGVVLMVGGNIPGITQVVSVQIYEHVEGLAYTQAHALSLLMLVFSFVVLSLVYGLNRRQNRMKGD